MKFYEHTLVAKQDLSSTEIKKIEDKYNDIINNTFAKKAIAKGADGVIAVAAGAGGHAGADGGRCDSARASGPG